MPFYPFLGEGSSAKKDYGKKGTLVLTSLLEDLELLAVYAMKPQGAGSFGLGVEVLELRNHPQICSHHMSSECFQERGEELPPVLPAGLHPAGPALGHFGGAPSPHQRGARAGHLRGSEEKNEANTRKAAILGVDPSHARRAAVMPEP